MEFQMTREEICVLLLTMNALRKTVKKGFKKKYGKDYKNVLNDYDYVTDLLTEKMETGKDDNVIILYERDYSMIESFINWYVGEVRKTIKKHTDDDQRMLEILDDIKNRLIEKKLANLI